MRIEVRAARKHFGKAEVLKGIDLDVPAGRRLALVGPNGSGKSTLIRALLGLIDCEGQVLLDGRSPFEDRIEVAKRLAYVPQVAPSLGASVRELVQLVCITRGLQSDEVARRCAQLNLSLEQVAKVPFRNLSGGMKQKLLLGIAFAANPTLLVMDEPTASLDEHTRRRFFDLCEALPQPVTMVLCSHRLEEIARLTSHVVALDEGRVAYDGAAESYSPAMSLVSSGGAEPLLPNLVPAFARADAQLPTGDDHE